MRELGIESLSSSQVSRAAKLLDEELQAWRERPLGEIKYLILDARHERMRHGGIVRGVEFIASADHSGLRAARRAVPGGATWQRCQFHLARNAIHHAPNAESRKRLGKQLKSIWTADDLARAETALAERVAGDRDSAPKLADWLEENLPEGLAVFMLPEHHRKRLRTSNPIERSVQQERKRRTVKIRLFPSEDALLRLVRAVLVEIDEKWDSDTKTCIKWKCRNA